MDNTPNISSLLEDPNISIAVVGASDDPDKYGAKIYRNLKGKGFRVFPVNPGRETVDGDRAYATIADLPEPPGIVNIVVPPRRTLQVLEHALELGFRTVWVQPGAADREVLDYLESEGFDYLADICIMVHSRSHV